MTEDGEPGVGGPSVRQNVMEEPRPNPSSVTTLPRRTVVLIVRENLRKLGNATPKLVKVKLRPNNSRLNLII